MWLINCTTRQLEQFEFDADPTYRKTPEYAILSHRWSENQEITFSEYCEKRTDSRKGWRKIEDFCKLTSQLGYNHCWIDTCCIDKRSSAELSEAINAMFQYYRQAAICCVYLKDFDSTSGHDQPSPQLDFAKLKQSKWFTRAWTLQELLAPQKCDFYDCDWKRIDSREELSGLIGQVTGIPEEYLTCELPFTNASIADRMCWASSRQCGRAEDRAYSLFGLFEVSMPLQYGEGGRVAFERLQRTIISGSDDESIFAWRKVDANQDPISGMLAPSPSSFAGCSGIAPARIDYREAYQFTNKGLHIKLETEATGLYVKTDRRIKLELLLAYLDCNVIKWYGHPRLACLLAPHAPEDPNDQRIFKYFRFGPLLCIQRPMRTRTTREIYIDGNPGFLKLSDRAKALNRYLSNPTDSDDTDDAIKRVVDDFHTRLATPYGV